VKFIKVEDVPFHKLPYRSSGKNGAIRWLILPFYRAFVDELPKGITSFIVTSDLQGRELNEKSNRLVGEAVAEEIELLIKLEEINVVDFVALAGDLYDYPDCRKLGGTGDVTTVWNAFAKTFKTVVGVHGNHDIVNESKLERNAVILDGETTSILSMHIGGVCGIVGKKSRNHRKSEIEFKESLTNVCNKKNDIVLLHQGPDDPVNQQLGQPFIREHLCKNGSSIVFFGHCHWDEPCIEMGNNQLLNVDNRIYIISESKT
jgi:Icc-related predicted phosphoesterase